MVKVGANFFFFMLGDELAKVGWGGLAIGRINHKPRKGSK